MSSLRGDRYTEDVFRSLGEREAAVVNGFRQRPTNVPANRAVINEGEVGASLYRIVEGWAYRFRRTGTGCRQIIDFLMPGQVIGLQAALLGVVEHSVTSLTPLRLDALDSRLVSEAFYREPDLALRFARHLAAEAGRVNELLTVVGCCDAVHRLAFLMLALYRRQARLGAVDPRDCPLPLRRQHLADTLGLTGAHVNRTLNRLRQDGVAVIAGHRLSILDLPQLAELAGGIAN